MRLHEALLCVLAVILPFMATVSFYAAFGLGWWTIAVPSAAFAISACLIWLVGWMVDHTYG